MTKSLQPAGALTGTKRTALLPYCSPNLTHMLRLLSENQSANLLAAEEIAENKMEFSTSHYASHVEKAYFL